ncbi:type II toxin-antitoxin system RelE/ParE family toxin [Candidatus Uhrbacteria bacterium]|nr:type II toxin-antitoxin system RelE/ParE family toxin [Candidatus Uhrbacteria bacterium]
MKTVIHKDALKALAHMQPKRARQIRDAIAAVAANPGAPGVDLVRLQGFDNAFRVRVGDWRVIVRRDGDTLFVTRIAPRGDVYKRK